MVALRKDVKVGLTIGAIAVLVIGVYAGLSALAGEKPSDAGQVKLDVASNNKAANTGSGTSVASRTNVPDTTKVNPPAPTGTVLTGINTGGSTVPPTNTASTPVDANSTDPLVAKAATEDPWAVAFGSGTLAPKKTLTPTPGTKADTATDRADTIKAINNPNGTTTGDTKTSTASANDGSGSITGGTNPPVLTRGNETTTPAAPAGPSKSHTVQPGENFSTIASEYYGDQKYVHLIIAANPSVNPNKLKPGTVLQIPALAKSEPKSDTTDSPSLGGAKATIDPTKQYVVKPGDSLYKICKTLWNDQDQSTKLYDLNKSVIGADSTKLKPGMVLTLPKAPTEKLKA